MLDIDDILVFSFENHKSNMMMKIKLTTFYGSFKKDLRFFKYFNVRKKFTGFLDPH